MRILVLSDSHRNTKTVLNIINTHSDIKHIFFLGDICSDIEAAKEKFPDRIYHIVSGNCDFSSSYPKEAFALVENYRIFFCHGHRHGVKYSLEQLKSYAIENNCTLALFGHTHRSLTAYDNGLYLVNPGSVSASREGAESYAIIDISSQGIMPRIMYVNK